MLSNLKHGVRGETKSNEARVQLDAILDAAGSRRRPAYDYAGM